MAKYVQVSVKRKTVGAYLKVIKALNELEGLGEALMPDERGISGISHNITWSVDAREWSFAEAPE